MSTAALMAAALTLSTAGPAFAAPSAPMVTVASSESAAPLAMKIYPVFVTAPGEKTVWSEADAAEQLQVAGSYWQTMSNGRVTMELQPAQSLESSVDLQQEDRKLVTESLNKELGVDPLRTSGAVYVYYLNVDHLSRNASASSWHNNQKFGDFRGSGGAIIFSTKSAPEKRANVLTHELGHIFALGHSNLVNCTDGTVDPTPTAEGWAENCSTVEYGDRFDIMGGGSFPTAVNSYSAYQRGFSSDAEVPAVTPGSEWKSYELSSWGDRNPSGQKAIRIQGSGVADTYFFEYRSGHGLDAGAISDAEAGIRVLKPAADRSSESILVPSPHGVGDFRNWTKGQVFINGAKNFALRVDSIRGDRATISLKTVDAAEAEELANPAPNVISAAWTAESYARGTNPTVTIEVKDRQGNAQPNFVLNRYQGTTLKGTHKTDSKGSLTIRYTPDFSPGTFEYRFQAADGSARELNTAMTVTKGQPTASITEQDGAVVVSAEGGWKPTGSASVKVNSKQITTVPAAGGTVKLSAKQAPEGSSVEVVYSGDTRHEGYDVDHRVEGVGVLKAAWTADSYERGVAAPELTMELKKPSGAPIAGYELQLIHGGAVAADGVTDANGKLTFTLSKGYNVGSWTFRLVDPKEQLTVPELPKLTIAASQPSLTLTESTQGTRVALSSPSGLTGSVDIAINGKAYKTVTTAEARSLLIPIAAAKNGAKIEARYAGDKNNLSAAASQVSSYEYTVSGSWNKDSIVRLKETALFTGTVVDRAGKPVSGAVVQRTGNSAGTHTTNSSGKFTITLSTKTPAGSYSYDFAVKDRSETINGGTVVVLAK